MAIKRISDFSSLSHLNQSYVTAPCRQLPGTSTQFSRLAKTLISIQPAAPCSLNAGMEPKQEVMDDKHRQTDVNTQERQYT